MKENIKKIILEIDNLIKSSHQKQNTLSIEKDLLKIKEDLNSVDNEIKNLVESEKKLESSQENFYNEFKEAVQNLRFIESEYEKWEYTFQNLNFSKEKIEIKLKEWEHQVNQFGCEANDFKELENVSLLSEGEANDLERRILKLQGELSAIGEIDESLINEAQKTEERYQFLSNQLEDLQKAIIDLENLIKDLNNKIEVKFKEGFSKINLEFDKFFKIMFGGGNAKLKLFEIPKKNSLNNNEELSDDNNEEINKEIGIDIEIKLPMKKLTSLDVLSGGERSLVSIAALFALISISPPPFLVLDEIDAMLDEKNAIRFAQMLKEYSSKTQFIVVTHNRAVMEVCDVIYGVTLGEDEASKIVSLKFEDTKEEIKVE